jgi:lysophospholipase L1-like esterase/ketosteroid isomerase-like protein
MKTILLLLSLAARPASDSTTFRQLISTYFNGIAAQRFTQMASACTDDFVLYEDGKVWNNDSVFKNIQYHKPFRVTFTQSDFKGWGDGQIGYGTYYNHADFTLSDTIKFTLDFVETAAYKKTPSGWKISLIHLTTLKDPVVDKPSTYLRFDSVRYIPDHYAERMKQFDAEAAQPGGIVFMGNSITEFGKWSTLLNNPHVYNRGIAADNTFGMLDRLHQVIDLKPAKVFIEAGINDVSQEVPVDIVVANISTMVEYLHVKSPLTQVYVWSILPTNDNCKKDFPEVAGKNDLALQANQLLKARAPIDGFTYFDVASLVTDSKGQLDTRYERGDGLHPNEAGYKLIIAHLP